MMEWGWKSDERQIHVMPINDTREHLDLRQCWCRPKVEEFSDGRVVIVHTSADGREFWEGDHTDGATVH